MHYFFNLGYYHIVVHVLSLMGTFFSLLVFSFCSKVCKGSSEQVGTYNEVIGPMCCYLF